MPYDERVRRGLQTVLAAHPWTTPQRQWLERLAKQVVENTVVDRAALDGEPFHQSGGFTKLNKVFDGRAEDVLAELQDAIWADAA